MAISRELANISWLLIDKSIRIFGTLFVGIWIARYLGPVDYGVLNYAIAYTILFSIFVNLGLEQFIIRELVRKPRLAPYLLGTAFILKILGAVVAIVCIFCSLSLIEIDNLTKFVILIISIGFLLQSIDVIDFYFKSLVLSKYVVIARNSSFLITSLLNIYFIVYEYSLIFFAITNVIYVLFTMIFLITLYKISGNKISKWRFSSKIAKNLLRNCWPLAISVFVISIHLRIDQVMIGNMMNSEQVGVYSVAVRLSEFWLFFPGIIVSTLFPYFVTLREKNIEMYRVKLLQLYSLMFWMGVIVGLTILLFGKKIIILLYGYEYENAYTALVFNIWNGVFISLALTRGIWLINENLQKYRMYNNLIIVIINILANLMLIPVLGIAGAALSTLLTQSIGLWVISFLWKPLRDSTMDTIRAINPLCLFGLRR